MDYLLDTNACIALINGDPATVRTRMQKAAAAGAHILVSSIALFELWYGVAKSKKQDFNRKRLEAFLAGPILMLPFEDDDSRVAGSVRAALESVGKPIGGLRSAHGRTSPAPWPDPYHCKRVRVLAGERSQLARLGQTVARPGAPLLAAFARSGGF
jgi:tRNA(fMet)-specific endonuclease VapC